MVVLPTQIRVFLVFNRIVEKVEFIHGKTYNTRQEAKTAIFEYIEGFYNRLRRHSYLGYPSSVGFEKKNVALLTVRSYRKDQVVSYRPAE
jgi:transposase InsO family protein